MEGKDIGDYYFMRSHIAIYVGAGTGGGEKGEKKNEAKDHGKKTAAGTTPSDGGGHLPQQRRRRQILQCLLNLQAKLPIYVAGDFNFKCVRNSHLSKNRIRNPGPASKFSAPFRRVRFCTTRPRRKIFPFFPDTFRTTHTRIYILIHM